MEEAGEVAKILLERGFVLLGILGLVVVERVFYPPLCPAVGLWKLALQKAHLACAKEKDPFPLQLTLNLCLETKGFALPILRLQVLLQLPRLFLRQILVRNDPISPLLQDRPPRAVVRLHLLRAKSPPHIMPVLRPKYDAEKCEIFA